MKHLQCLITLTVLLVAALGGAPARAQEREAVVLIGHASVPRIDAPTAQKLYTGRAVEIGNQAVTVFNAAAGSKARERFMASVMAMDDGRYVAYWTVRKHVGKGTPPREFQSATELIEHVQANPGSVGYLLASELRPGLNVILRP
jgi:ABC-type phosphate transport system substrate-binding protein